MTKASFSKLSRRERQIMDIVYKLGEASVQDVLGVMTDPPSYSAVRATMNLLKDKGQLKHEQQGAKYLYKPIIARDNARRTALSNLLNTFFDGSAEQVVLTLIHEQTLSESELERLSKLIDEARNEGR